MWDGEEIAIENFKAKKQKEMIKSGFGDYSNAFVEDIDRMGEMDKAHLLAEEDYADDLRERLNNIEDSHPSSEDDIFATAAVIISKEPSVQNQDSPESSEGDNDYDKAAVIYQEEKEEEVKPDDKVDDKVDDNIKPDNDNMIHQEVESEEELSSDNFDNENDQDEQKLKRDKRGQHPPTGMFKKPLQKKS